MKEYTSGHLLNQFGAMLNSSWREKVVDIKKGANDIDFADTMPNIFIIQNTSGNDLKISLSGVANDNNYEFKVSANSTKPVGTPIPRSQISVFNPTANEFTVRIFAVNAPIDLSIYADVNTSINGASITTDGIVKGFGSGVSLPSGSNTLGKVELSDLLTNLFTAMNNSMSTLVNGANLKNLLTELQTLNIFISTLVSTDVSTEHTNLTEILNAVTNKNTYCESVESTVTSSAPITITKDITRIAYVSNDGASLVTLTCNTADGAKVFTVRAGEVLTDIKCRSNSISVTSSASVDVRVAVEYEA